ncbi:MAG: hypothetical protein JWR07_4555, partial [Nevskia sp.]|nr:hypothetical protein [Nevskia sp.]
GGAWSFLLNRISFTVGVSQATTAETREWTPSSEAPFQKFQWVDFPPTDNVDRFQYRVTAMQFGAGNALVAGPSATVAIDFKQDFREAYSDFRAGFTRGYLSSQAYAEKFHNADIRPAGAKTMDYATAPFEAQYQWLGYSARRMMFEFLDECVKDKSLKVDLFGYDLDEPDFIRGLQQLAREKRLRAFLDDAPLHTKAGAVEPQVYKSLAALAPGAVFKGHFSRFAHDKVLIQRDATGKPLKVFTGSANFSVRGLYVQANNVLVIEDAVTAGVYGQVFDTVFNAAKAGKNAATVFKASDLSKDWYEGSVQASAAVPKFHVSFAPHADSAVSLAEVSNAITNAKRSVMFAVMELDGGGDVLKALSTLNTRGDVFSYGITQSDSGVSLFKPGSAQHGEFATFAYLSKQVPAPFRAESSGGAGQVIHNKFVVVDFDGDNPVVFTGSSNLAAGGESQNGDNLLAIYDRRIATAYAAEAVRLVDHYHFRMLQKQHPSTAPVTLQGQAATAPRWWAAYYQPGSNKYQERILFAGGVPPAVVKPAAPVPVQKAATKKAPTKKAAKKPAIKKAVKKPAATPKSASKKPAAKKTVAKKAAVKKAAKKAVKKVAKRTAPRKTAAKKSARR